MSERFVHLRLHTEYSLIDSVVRVAPLMDAVAGAGMAAVGLTDQNNLFAMVKFYRAALARGIKPVIGVGLLVSEGAEHLLEGGGVARGPRAPSPWPSRTRAWCRAPRPVPSAVERRWRP